ncbi:cytochrome P450 [Xylogone sp. PMI_703]|nr:cytochrome P450 [Xylogone sp. PMI_703]
MAGLPDFSAVPNLTIDGLPDFPSSKAAFVSKSLTFASFGQLAAKSAVLLLSAAVAYVFSVIIYRLFFHPYAKYPGPFLAKITPLYAGYHAWKGDLHVDMWRAHLKYGTYVRYAPNRLMMNTNTALNEIYGSKKPVKKAADYIVMAHQAQNTLTFIDKVEHGRRRRLMSQGFSTAKLRSYEPKILKRVRNFCVAIRRGEIDIPLTAEGKKDPTLKVGEWSAPIDMSKMSNYFAFDVMADVVFGQEYDLLGTTRFRYVTESIEASNVRMGALLQSPILTWARLDKWLFPAALYGRNRFLRFVGGLLRRLNETDIAKSGAIFSALATFQDPVTGTGLTPQQIVAESTTMIVAGSDTTSTAVAGLFFYLTRNPDAYVKVCKEIRSTFKSVDEIELGTALNSCVYLKACIDETMRISPSVGSALWREVEAQGTDIDGIYIPGGCDVGTGIYSIHHNPNYYPDPFSYKPERWLASEQGTEAVALAQSAFNPFSLGPRGCIGRSLAIAEMQLLLSTIIFLFDFKCESHEGEGKAGAELGREKPGEFQLFDHVTSAKEGPIIQFRERDLSN